MIIAVNCQKTTRKAVNCLFLLKSYKKGGKELGKNLIKVTGFRIPEDILEELTRISKEKNIIRNQLVIQILKEYIDKNKTKNNKLK